MATAKNKCQVNQHGCSSGRNTNLVNAINNSNVIKRQQCTTKGINRNKVQVYTWRDFHQHTKDSKWILQWSSATTKSQMLPIYCRGFVI
ncbi:unnamed protein product [Schistosoma guineensis]|nr:unnamed protein product [Schistosoma guineensis]